MNWRADEFADAAGSARCGHVGDENQSKDQHQPPRELELIEADIKSKESNKDILVMLKEVTR